MVIGELKAVLNSSSFFAERTELMSIFLNFIQLWFRIGGTVQMQGHIGRQKIYWQGVVTKQKLKSKKCAYKKRRWYFFGFEVSMAPVTS